MLEANIARLWSKKRLRFGQTRLHVSGSPAEVVVFVVLMEDVLREVRRHEDRHVHALVHFGRSKPTEQRSASGKA